MGVPQESAALSPLPRVVVLISTRIVGGPAKGLLQVVPELIRRRFDVVICTFADKNEPPSPFVRACTERRIPLYLLRQRFHYDWTPLASIRALLDVPRACVQTHGYKESVFGLLASRMSGKPWIAFQHGTTEENLKVRLYHKLDRRVVTRADAIVTVSRELADRQIRTAAKHRVCIIENAIEAPPFRIARQTKPGPWGAAGPRIGCIGRLSPEKGQRQLIAAARALAAQGLAFTLVFAGDGPERRRLEDLVAGAGLGLRVRFLGHVEDISMVYATLDMLVLPSLREGMPNVILEAMQRSLPIVASRVGAIPDMLVDGRSGLLAPAGDVSALAAALGALVRDPRRAYEMGRRAREALYPRFLPETRLARFEHLYNRILESP